MRRSFILLVSVALYAVPLLAQTAAQKALNNEPEVREIAAESANLTAQQQLPNNDIRKPLPAGIAFGSFMSIKNGQALLDHLEERLNNEARACNFCSSKQDELSELISERASFLDYVANSDTGMGALFADATNFTARWRGLDFSLREAGDALIAHCNRLKAAPDDICKQPDRAAHLAGAHEQAWAKCFKEHNWVEASSKRLAYEACMNENDPFTKMCNQERKISPQEQSCPQFTVNYADIAELSFYNDRWNTDPDHLAATATIISNQPAHIVLLDSVVVPPIPAGGKGFQITVRGRLENPVEGAYDQQINRSTANAIALKPDTAAGLSSQVMLVPAGTEVPVSVRLDASGGDTANGGILTLQVVKNQNGQFITQEIFRHMSWPADGTVLIPANSSLSFAMQCGCLYPMSVSEFRKRAAAPATPATATYVTRPILSGSRLQVRLLDAIDVPSLEAGKRSFHAQLNADMVMPQGPARSDAILLPKGTDVYMKVIDQDAGPALGHNIRISVDYVIFNGQQIPLSSVELRDNYHPPRQTNQISRVRQPAQVMWNAGDSKWLDVFDQAEVPAAGATPVLAGPSPAGAPAATVAATSSTPSAANPSPQSAVTPTGAAQTSAAPSSSQAQTQAQASPQTQQGSSNSKVPAATTQPGNQNGGATGSSPNSAAGTVLNGARSVMKKKLPF